MSSYFDLDLTIDEFLNFFEIGHKDVIGQVRYTCHKLFDSLSRGDHERAKDNLEISVEWEFDSSVELQAPLKFVEGKRIALFLICLKSGGDVLWASDY